MQKQYRPWRQSNFGYRLHYMSQLASAQRTGLMEVPVSVGSKTKEAHECDVREALAACFRFFAREGMNEGVANHLSYQFDFKEDGDGSNTMIVNGFGWHFANVTESSLVKLDIDDPQNANIAFRPGATQPPIVDPTAICIHGEIHKLLGKRARCIMHLHPHYATALSCLEDPRLLAVDQTTARFFNRLSYDRDMDGMGLGDEAKRLATCIGSRNSALLLGQHGVLVVGESIHLALDEIYHLERAARTYVTALSTGRPIKVLSDEVAEKTASQWEEANDVSGKALLWNIMNWRSEPELESGECKRRRTSGSEP